MKQQLWKNFWALIKPYWTSEEKWIALLLLAGVVWCNILQVRLMVIFNEWNKLFYDALQAFHMRYIILALGEFVIMLILAIVIFTYVTYLGGILVNRWRRWMTHYYVENWLDRHTAYAMQILNKNLENPDQRISEDLSELPTLTLSLFSGLLNSALTLVSFSVILWELSGDLKFTISNYHFHIPGYMFWATLIYSAIGTVIIGWMGKNLMMLNYLRERFNANFRFGLIRVRESSEQIALYRGQKTETQGLKSLFEPVFHNFRDIIVLQKYLGFFVNGYNLLVQVVGILIALPRYIGERLAIGTLFQVNNAFGQVVGALSFVVFSFSNIASWRASIYRLTEFTQLMEEAKKNIEQKNLPMVLSSSRPQTIEASSLSLALPSRHMLASNLNFNIAANEHVLITGKFGSGKSTLLRAMANIWPYSEGTLQMPEGTMLFLPQKPYFPLGTLKQALLYPQQDDNSVSDQEIETILDDCGIGYLKKMIHEFRYWPLELSGGEQQLVAFARIFIAKPQWIFLDEATSALDEETEKKMYELLQSRFPAMTIVSVGHRSSLKKFHHKEIFVEKQERV